MGQKQRSVGSATCPLNTIAEIGGTEMNEYVRFLSIDSWDGSSGATELRKALAAMALCVFWKV